MAYQKCTIKISFELRGHHPISEYEKEERLITLERELHEQYGRGL